MTSHPSKTPLKILAGLIVLLASGGCTQLDLSKALSLPGSIPKPQVPERLVDVWTETVLNQSGRRGVRGFGGRVMFYAKGSEEPVVVDGTLTVYAFDDSRRPSQSDPETRGAGAETDHQSPDKKYVFTREQLPKHYSKSELGHSYSFWIPWDEVGGEQKQITLIGRYVDTTGKVVMSQPCHQTLPGIRRQSEEADDPKAEQAADSKLDSGVRPASYDEPKEGAAPGSAKEDKPGTTTTIDVPPSFARRLRAAATASDEKTSQTNVFGINRSGPSEKSARTDRSPNSETATESTKSNPQPGEKTGPPATADSSSARSLLSRFPVRRERAVRPAPNRVRMRPYTATGPSALPRTPRWETSAEPGSTPQTASEKSD